MVDAIPKITQDMIDFVINWSEIASSHTIVATSHNGKSRNIWVDVKDVYGKGREEVESILQEKAVSAFEEK